MHSVFDTRANHFLMHLHPSNKINISNNQVKSSNNHVPNLLFSFKTNNVRKQDISFLKDFS